MISAVAFIFCVPRANFLQPGPASVSSQARHPALSPLSLLTHGPSLLFLLIHGSPLSHFLPYQRGSIHIGVLQVFLQWVVSLPFGPPHIIPLPRAWLHLHSTYGPMRALVSQLTQDPSGKTFLMSHVKQMPCLSVSLSICPPLSHRV